jgi:hypothetical protein
MRDKGLSSMYRVKVDQSFYRRISSGISDRQIHFSAAPVDAEPSNPAL